jgi:multidrug efflux pump subunit AcrA (membrane-fusion protein)
VSQAQPVYVLAIDGDRDALFNVYEWALANVELDKGLDVSMVTDPNVKAVGTVRLVSPAVNANTMTVQIRFGIATTPAAMALGAVVNGAAPLRPRKVVLLPWEAVFEQGGKPAVWVVDARASTVSLQPVTIDRYARDTIAVTGLSAGLTIVSAGGQLLRPGQKVETVAERKP